MVRYARRSYRKRVIRKRPTKAVRRYRRYPKRVGIRRSPTEFPSSMFMKLRFTEDRPLNITVGSGALTSYSMNSPFDPLYGLGGGSCSGFAQFAAVYERYLCTGCKVVFTGVATANDNSSLVVGMRARPSSHPVPTGTSFYGDWLIESKSPCYRRLPSWVTPQPYSRWSLTKYFSVKGTEAVKSLEDVYYAATTAADPTNQPLVDIVAGYTTGTGTCVLDCHVTITYYVKFFRPKIEENVAV